jgi:2,3-dihydroxybenzoate-AMP ligase
LPNIAEFLSTVFGLFRAGVLPVFALPAHRQSEIVHAALASQATAYVIAAEADAFDYRDLAAALCRQVPSVQRVIVVAGAPGPFAALPAARAEDAASLPLPRPSDVAFLQMSGGSTGLPKLIPRTHDDYIYSLRASAEICRLDGDSVYLGVLPIAHNFPMSSPGVLGTLYAGGRVVLASSPSPETAFAVIRQEGVTIAALVPPLALIWLQAAEASPPALTSLRILQVGGAKFNPEVARRVRPLLGATLQQVFGMAEGLVNYTRLDDPEDIVVETQGRPISPDDEIRIVDPDGRPVAPGVSGLLLTRGPYTIRAYHDNPDANARSFTPDGFYRTGDMVRLTPEGNLIVEGRATDHINRGGEKVSAEEVENHLLAHPAVHDAVVVSIPDPYLGERSCAFVVARGQPPSPATLRRWIRDRGLAEFKIPDQVRFMTHFQTTAAGKISRQDLRAHLRRQWTQALPLPDQDA